MKQVNQTQTRRIFSEVRAPSSTSPPSPRRISNHYNFHKELQSHRSTQLLNHKYKYLLVIKRPQTLFWKIFFPYKNPIEQCVGLKLKYCKWKREWNWREFWIKNFSKERDFSAQNRELKTLLKAFKLWIFLQMLVVIPTTLINHIYRIELGIKE